MPALLTPALLALALAAPGADAAPPRNKEPAPEEWVERYYQQPRPELLARMVYFLDRKGALDQDRARLAGFFSVLFRRPGAGGPRFVHTAMLSLEGRYTLAEALWLAGHGEAAYGIARSRGMKVERFRGPAPDPLRSPVRGKEDVERLWGAFLASGDAAYPRRLVDLLDRPAPRGEAWRPDASARDLARASLGAHAREHEVVLRLLRDEAQRRRGPARAALAGLLYRMEAEAAAPSQRMTRIVARAVPGAPGAGPRRPITIHRLGDAFGRIEETPAPGEHRRRLLVAAGPDEWRVDASGPVTLHRTSPGPGFAFRAPLAPPDPGGKAPAIELGRELEYLRARGATLETRSQAGVLYDVWSVREGTYHVELLADPCTARPRRVHVRRTGRTVAELEYVEYERDLAPRLELFAPPEGPIVPAR